MINKSLRMMMILLWGFIFYGRWRSYFPDLARSSIISDVSQCGSFTANLAISKKKWSSLEANLKKTYGDYAGSGEKNACAARSANRDHTLKSLQKVELQNAELGELLAQVVAKSGLS